MKPPDPERLATLSEKAQRLSALKDQPGWADLTAIVEREERKYFDLQLRQLRNGEQGDPVDIKAHSVAFDLIRYLLAHPEKAETSLKRAIDKAERVQAIREEVTA